MGLTLRSTTPEDIVRSGHQNQDRSNNIKNRKAGRRIGKNGEVKIEDKEREMRVK